MARPPSRSPSTPNIGPTSVPRYCSDPNAVRKSTDPVWTITYQPRINVSISNAHDARRSAGHWKRKLRTRKAASIIGRGPDSYLHDLIALHRLFIELEPEARPLWRHELTLLDPRHRGEDAGGSWHVLHHVA